MTSFDHPPISGKQGKLWGSTQLVFHHNSIEAHSLDINKGGYSSKHSHRNKHNRFVVLDGKIRVTQWLGDTEDVTELSAGQITDVSPGVLHMFEALEDSLVVEIYWVTLCANDIQRENTGGMRYETD